MPSAENGFAVLMYCFLHLILRFYLVNLEYTRWNRKENHLRSPLAWRYPPYYRRD